MRIGYAGQNGRDYVGIGRLMRERGLLEPGQTTMQGIVAWLRAHPEEGRAIMRENKSYVFFQELTGAGPLGALGLPVTPRATRRRRPANSCRSARRSCSSSTGAEANGLWIAQDTGGAIKGANRFDTFWGAGAEAARDRRRHAGRGRAWILLPKGHAGPARCDASTLRGEAVGEGRSSRCGRSRRRRLPLRRRSRPEARRRAAAAGRGPAPRLPSRPHKAPGETLDGELGPPSRAAAWSRRTRRSTCTATTSPPPTICSTAGWTGDRGRGGLLLLVTGKPPGARAAGEARRDPGRGRRLACTRRATPAASPRSAAPIPATAAPARSTSCCGVAAALTDTKW